MPFSAFTGFGGLSFSSASPRAQAIYDSIVSLHGGNFEDNFAGPINAEWYAIANAIANARDALARAEAQSDPTTVHEMLPVLEKMYGLSPGPNDSANDRRAALTVRYKIALEPTQQNVFQALRTLLGADLLAWVPNTVTNPSPTTIPTAMCKLPTSRFKTIALLDPVTDTTAKSVIRYSNGQGLGDFTDLFDGDTVVVDPVAMGLQEVITIVGKPNGILYLQFAATHEANTIGVVGPFPNWSSFKKHGLVVVKNGRANDPTIKSKVNDLLSRILSGTSTWDVVEESTVPGTAGPIRVGVSSIGIVPIGAVTYPSL